MKLQVLIGALLILGCFGSAAVIVRADEPAAVEAPPAGAPPRVFTPETRLIIWSDKDTERDFWLAEINLQTFDAKVLADGSLARTNEPVAAGFWFGGGEGVCDADYVHGLTLVKLYHDPGERFRRVDYLQISLRSMREDRPLPPELRDQSLAQKWLLGEEATEICGKTEKDAKSPLVRKLRVWRIIAPKLMEACGGWRSLGGGSDGLGVSVLAGMMFSYH